jgi:hypothetical protein
MICVGIFVLPWGFLAAPSAANATQGLDACALITKPEVDAATKHVLAHGAKSTVANLSSCAFADPKMPMMKPVSLNVLVASSAADAKKAYEIAKSNAASVEAVTGVGEQAYWDKYLHTLQTTKGKYQVDLTVDGDFGGLDAAKALLTKALARLP